METTCFKDNVGPKEFSFGLKRIIRLIEVLYNHIKSRKTTSKTNIYEVIVKLPLYKYHVNILDKSET